MGRAVRRSRYHRCSRRGLRGVLPAVGGERRARRRQAARPRREGAVIEGAAAMIRSITGDDLVAILALNNAHAEEVNAVTAERLASLVAIAEYARVIDGGHGFLLAFGERTPEQGPNHGWF